MPTVNPSQMLTAGGQQLEIAYRIELSRDTKQVAEESLQVGKFAVGPDDGRMFLADFSIEPFTLERIESEANALDSSFNRRNGMVGELRAPNPRLSGDKIADEIFALVETMKQRSIAVRSFLAADPPATPVAFLSGDPRNLSPAEVRAIWDVLTEVEVPADDRANAGDSPTAEPLTSRTGAKVLPSDRYRTNYGYLPGVKEEEPDARGRQILDVISTRRRFAASVAHRFALHVLDGPRIERGLHIPETSGPWFWGEWNGVRFQRRSESGPINVVGETKMLDIEATELHPPDGAQPRRLRLVLKAKPMTR